MVTPANCWWAISATPSSGRRPRSPRLRSPNTKQRHRRAFHAEQTGSKSGEGGRERILRGQAGKKDEEKRPREEVCPVLLTARGSQQNRTLAVASQVDQGRKSARGSARSLCAARCAHGKAARSAPPRRQWHDTTRGTGVKHARTRFRLTPALGAPWNQHVRRRGGATTLRSGSRELFSENRHE